MDISASEIDLVSFAFIVDVTVASCAFSLYVSYTLRLYLKFSKCISLCSLIYFFLGKRCRFRVEKKSTKELKGKRNTYIRSQQMGPGLGTGVITFLLVPIYMCECVCVL